MQGSLQLYSLGWRAGFGDGKSALCGGRFSPPAEVSCSSRWPDSTTSKFNASSESCAKLPPEEAESKVDIAEPPLGCLTGMASKLLSTKPWALSLLLLLIFPFILPVFLLLLLAPLPMLCPLLSKSLLKLLPIFKGLTTPALSASAVAPRFASRDSNSILGLKPPFLSFCPEIC